MDLDELRRRLKTGELYGREKEPFDGDDEELWERIASNPSDLIDNVPPAQLAEAFEKAVSGFKRLAEVASGYPHPIDERIDGVLFDIKTVEKAIERVKHGQPSKMGLGLLAMAKDAASSLAFDLERKQALEREMEAKRCPGTVCERCAGAPAFTFPSMTAYSWDGEGEDPNRDLTLCALCGEEHTETMEEQWRDYYAGCL